MQVKEYVEKKSKGLAEVVKAGGGYAFAIKNFSSDDGSELDPIIESINLDDMKQQKLNLEAEIQDHEMLIVDIEVLK